MITLRRAGDRQHEQRGQRDSWYTFFGGGLADPLAGGFDTLELLDEFNLSPVARMPRHARRDTESVTYVREGSLAYDDSLGRSGIIQAGEFQRTTIGRGVRYNEENASQTDSAHVIRAALHPSRVGLAPGQERKRFSVAERRGGVHVVASGDARGGSLKLQQDVLVHSGLLEPGQHVAYELSPGRSVWLQVVQGELTLADIVLTAGDGVGIRAKHAVSFTAAADTEVLLFDLVAQPVG